MQGFTFGICMEIHKILKLSILHGCWKVAKFKLFYAKCKDHRLYKYSKVFEFYLEMKSSQNLAILAKNVRLCTQ